MGKSGNSLSDDDRVTGLTERERRRGLGDPRPFGSAAAEGRLLSDELLAGTAASGAAGLTDDVSLGFLLRQSANAISRSRAMVVDRGAAISRIIAAAAQGDARLAAQAARLLIALFWVFLAVMLAKETAGGGATRGLAATDAASLSRIFAALGVLGVASAMVGGLLVKARARSAEETARRAATDFGAEIGAVARGFSEAVARLSARIGDSGAASAGDIARLHLIAAEAAAFLGEVDFAAEPDHQHAAEKFGSFLKSAERRAERSGAPAIMFVLVGALIGAALLSLATSPPPPLASASDGFGLTRDLPLWALSASLGFAILYSLAGALFSAASAGEAGAVSPTLDAAISDLRKAFAESGAPKLDGLAASVEAAIGSFVARQEHDSGRLSVDRLEAGPPWRRPSEPPRFEPQTFVAAPPLFRVDAQGGGEKIFPRKVSRNAAPKQSSKALETPSRLND
jgi:hypothetical protein